MGTWMSHLRIAEKLLERIDGLDPEMFAIGNIGPDSGLPDEKRENFDPPKAVSHFEYREDSSDCADLVFYRKYLKDVSLDEKEKYSFLLGYFIHLVTDNLWMLNVWKPHKEKYQDWLEQNKDEFAAETKRDWYGQDFIFVRDHPDSFFFRIFLNAGYDQNYLDFMSPAAFEHQIQYIKTFYQRTDEAVQAVYEREFKYLNQEQMDQFVDSAVETLMQAFNRLKENDLNGHTILELLELA
jgi:hypothetical protein